MTKDSRFETLKILIEGNHITEFSQLFKHIAKSAVSDKMGIHYNRFEKIIADPGALTVTEVYILSGLIGIEAPVLFGIIHNQKKNFKSPAKKSSRKK